MSDGTTHIASGGEVRDDDPNAGQVGSDGRSWRLRMKDLCDQTGLSRQVIHFYIREGLLPPGLKASRNSAFYGDIHIERLQLIRRLQAERFLPLRAIRAVLDEDSGPFTREQRAWIRDLKAASASSLARGSDRLEKVAVEPLLAEYGITQQELDEMSGMGLVPVVDDPECGCVIAVEDTWLLSLLGELRRSGFTEDRGFRVVDLAIYEEAISGLFDKETAMLAERISRFRPSEAAPMLERLLPLVNAFLTRYHETRIRRFFAMLT